MRTAEEIMLEYVGLNEITQLITRAINEAIKEAIEEMEQTNKLPSRFQIGDEVMLNQMLAKVIGVEFTESKVNFNLKDMDGYKYLHVDSIYVSPVEKQELPDTIIK